MRPFEWQQRIGLEYPVVQAGMGGAVTTSELASAVSNAGGLGTIGIMPASQFREELAATKRQCGERPFAANLLMPFTKKPHIRACLEVRPALVVLFYGHSRKVISALQAAGITVFSQIGNPDQARTALAAGVDGLIAQGHEAGGHLASNQPLDSIFETVRKLAAPKPVLAAGGIFDAASASRCIAQGAAGVVAGTRFLLTPESNAHAHYKTALLSASSTVTTTLYGLSWLAPHRVAESATTKRWCTADGTIPWWVSLLDTASAPSRYLLSLQTAERLSRLQTTSLPLYTPLPLVREMNERLLDVTPLYAGQCVKHIETLLPAAQVVAQLTPA